MPKVKNKQGKIIDVNSLIYNNESLLKKYGYTRLSASSQPAVKPVTARQPKKSVSVAEADTRLTN